MKKLLSVLLVVLLCVGVCPISTLAADEEFVLTAEGGMALVGGKITVPVVVTKNSGWRALEVRVSYDADVLEIECPNHNDSEYCMGESAPAVTKKEDFAMATEYECDNLGVNSPRHTANPYIFQWAYPTIDEDITETGTYASITFKVKDEAALGETTVGLYIDIITNCDYEHPTTVTNDATVKVVDEFPVPEAPATVKGKDSNGVVKDIHANDDTTSVTVESYDAVKNEVNLSFSYDTTHEAYGDTVEWYKGDELIATGLTATVPYNTYNANDYSVVVEYENYLSNAGGFETYATATSNQTNAMLPYVTKNVPNTAGSATTAFEVYEDMPHDELWGMYTTFKKLGSGYAYSDEYWQVTDKGLYGTDGTGSYFIYGIKGTQSCYGSTNKVTPRTGNGMLLLRTASRSAIKEITGLTAGKTYLVSFYVHDNFLNANYNAETGLYSEGYGTLQSAVVANSVQDIATASSVQATTRGAKLYGASIYGNAKADSKEAKWQRYELYFTPESDTAYLHITATGPIFLDDVLCQEYKADKTEWNFEDGNMISGIITSDTYLTASQASIFTVKDATPWGLNKLGNKYLEIDCANGRWNNNIFFNFNYEKGYRYTISYDFKVIKYAPSDEANYGEDLNNTNKTTNPDKYMTETNIQNTMDAYLNTFSAEKTTINNTHLVSSRDYITITRYHENGKAYNYATTTPAGVNNYYTCTSARTVTDDADTGYTYQKFANNSTVGGDLWDEWVHWEIEFDPAGIDYEGFASYGFNFTGKYAVYGIDNFKVEKYALSDIAAADDAHALTNNFNIRAISNNGQGLRFKSTVDLGSLGLISADDGEDANYDAITGTFANGSKIVEYGTLVGFSDQYYDHSRLVRALSSDMAKNSWAVAGVAYNLESGRDIRYKYENGVVTYTGVLINIPTQNYDTVWAVRSYVIIEDANKQRTVVYSDVITISMVAAANAVIENSPAGAKDEPGTDAYIAQTEVLDIYYANQNQANRF